MERNYEELVIEIIAFDTEDIITESDLNGDIVNCNVASGIGNQT